MMYPTQYRPTEPASDAHMRASDADRERMEKLLERHHAEGRLTMEELADRLGRARAAVTLGDLRALAVDLPGDEPADPARGARRGWGWGRGFPLAPIVAAVVALSVLRAISFWAWGWGPGWYPHRHFVPIFPGPLFVLLVAWLVVGRRRRWGPPRPRL